MSTHTFTPLTGPSLAFISGAFCKVAGRLRDKWAAQPSANDELLRMSRACQHTAPSLSQELSAIASRG